MKLEEKTKKKDKQGLIIKKYQQYLETGKVLIQKHTGGLLDRPEEVTKFSISRRRGDT